MIFNDPSTLAEVRAAFYRYERALLDNDAAVLDAMFVHRDDTIRFGVGEWQYGIDAIRAFRAVQQPFERVLDGLEIVAYGHDVATASTLFHRTDLPGLVGRQQQTWVRTATGWCVAAAHVSMIKGS
ncbi:oxalurate catabolism protein HpxZ [uncultured Devosia sp.]|uniref:oxalurate catabolism protein HpxZ n=1 Tax=uncultured Devosia sp. TaxID=211434 RepID=UPI0035CAE6A4